MYNFTTHASPTRSPAPVAMAPCQSRCTASRQDEQRFLSRPCKYSIKEQKLDPQKDQKETTRCGCAQEQLTAIPLPFRGNSTRKGRDQQNAQNTILDPILR